MFLITFFFFFSSRRRHTRLQGDWSSDVCSSDLLELGAYAFSSGGAAALDLDGLDELAQHESRVAQERVVSRVVLVEVALVVGGVDERLAGRDTCRHPVAGEA